MRSLNRIERIKRDPYYVNCLGLNGRCEKYRVFCRHDYQHMLFVSRISVEIVANTVGLDGFADLSGLPGTPEAVEVIGAAGLLHDMGRWLEYDAGEDHALAGAGMAVKVMERAGFNKREIDVAVRAIGEHRRAGPGTSLLGRVLCLADDLSRPCGGCGAVGDCYKREYMENIKKRNRAGYCLGL